jgi:hypothetical protein
VGINLQRAFWFEGIQDEFGFAEDLEQTSDKREVVNDIPVIVQVITF